MQVSIKHNHEAGQITAIKGHTPGVVPYGVTVKGAKDVMFYQEHEFEVVRAAEEEKWRAASPKSAIHGVNLNTREIKAIPWVHVLHPSPEQRKILGLG